ncbi:MAG: hypothetical protein AAFX86_15610 [Pseudomonadota bacterium]
MLTPVMVLDVVKNHRCGPFKRILETKKDLTQQPYVKNQSIDELTHLDSLLPQIPRILCNESVLEAVELLENDRRIR